MAKHSTYQAFSFGSNEETPDYFCRNGKIRRRNAIKTLGWLMVLYLYPSLFWCNKSKWQLRATRQTCSRICEDGFPFPGSLRRHGRAAHPAARKVREPVVVGLRDVLSRLFSANCTAQRVRHSVPSPSVTRNSETSYRARDKTSVYFSQKFKPGNFVRDIK